MKIILAGTLLIGSAALALAQTPRTVEVPPPLESIAQTIDDQGANAEQAAEIEARRRLNAGIAARVDATNAQHAAALAEHKAALAAHRAALLERERAAAEYAVARAVYEQRQKEIADWQACVDGDRTRCAKRP